MVDLTGKNVEKFLINSELVIDGFDNSGARAVVTHYCKSAQIPCLHVGLAGDYAEIIWNEVYRVPSAEQDDFCDFPLVRNLVLLAVAVASQVFILFVQDGSLRCLTVTLQDLAFELFL